MEPTRARARLYPVVRRLLPWVVGFALLIAVAMRVPLETFGDAIQHGPHVAIAAVTLAMVILILITDATSTWLGLLVVGVRRPLATVFAVRGATNALFIINYAVGQGGFGYYLHRSGEPALRAVGATLFLMGTNLATLLLLATIAWASSGGDTSSAMWWTLLGGCIAFVVYLGVIAASPGFLARREILQPLFHAGLRGHAFAIAGRIPHMSMVVLSIWLAMRAWGIEVPIGAAIALMPVVVIATVLPISPAGLGTAQAAMIYFFSEFAVGGTPDERAANVLAFGIVHFAYNVAWLLIVGLVCVPLARRWGALADREI